MADTPRTGLLEQLRSRGVLRVAASYAVIGWLLLQIADVTFEPLGLPRWAMTALIVAIALGFPTAVLLAWFFELGDHGVTRDSAAAAEPRPQVHGARRYADLAIIGLLLVVVAVLLVRQSDLGKPPPPAKPTLAVLAFRNLSADPEQQYFSDGLAEDVLDKLGQVPGLMVVSRSSSFSFRDENQDVRKIAEKLGVNVVLEGAVRRAGKRLRLSAKLIDGKTGQQLWSGSFDREVNDIFAVQAELAQAVIDAIVPVARGDTAVNALNAPPPTTSLSAYDLFLLGRAKANTRWPTDMQSARQLFEQALELDPKFARAHAALANTLVLLVEYDEDPLSTREERVERAETAVYQALALDGKLAESHVALGNLLRTMQRPGAEDAYRKAIELNPNSAEAWHNYSVYLSRTGTRDLEADRATARAHELDPLALSTLMNQLDRILRPGAKAFRAKLQKANAQFAGNPNAQRRLALVAGMSGYPLEAWELVTASRRDPSFNVPRSTAAVGPLGLRLYVDPEFVVTNGERLLVDPEIEESKRWLLASMITAHGLLGNEGEVRALLDQYVPESGEDARRLHSLRAFWLAALGHEEEAAASLDLAGTIPDETPSSPLLLGGSNNMQGLPATLRIYRATGREREAAELARRYQDEYRAAQPRNPDITNYEYWVRDAALAANEGQQEEAIRCLRQAMRWQDIPIGFAPGLPWFKSLEGYAPYDVLLREREARAKRAHEAMLALDATVSKPL